MRKPLLLDSDASLERAFMPGRTVVQWIKSPLTLDSILRLDEMQSVAINNLEQTDFCLSEEVKAVLKSRKWLFSCLRLAVRNFGDIERLLKAE
jgi:hypothetical protein